MPKRQFLVYETMHLDVNLGHITASIDRKTTLHSDPASLDDCPPAGQKNPQQHSQAQNLPKPL